MKKTSFLSLMAVAFIATLLFVGCQKDTTTLRARIDNFGGNGKVYMGGQNGNVPTWSLGDTIWIDHGNNADHSYVLNDISSSGASLTVPNWPSYCAIYPFGLGDVAEGTTTATLSIPQEQRYYTKNNSQVVNAPMAAYTGNDPAGTITFHNLGALLAITIECNIRTHASMDIDEVRVHSESEFPLWGDASVNLSDPNAIYQCTAATSGDPYTIYLRKFNASNQQVKLFSLDTTTNKTKTVYVYVPAVPSGTNNRYTIEVKAHNGSTDLSISRTQQSATGGNLPRNMMANIDFPMRNIVAPAGAVPDGKFSIANGVQVFFAAGNLQYQCSTHVWRIAPNQWEFIGDGSSFRAPGVNYGNNMSIANGYDGWIDLFGWATSGYHNIGDSPNIRYQPYDWENSTTATGMNTTVNYYGYGPSTNMTDKTTLTGTSANYDWGVYHSNPSTGDNPNGGLYYVDENNNLQKAGIGVNWRTLTDAEWKYLLGTRVVNGGTDEGHTWSGVVYNGVYGILIYPDGYQGQYTADVTTITSIPSRCVFLPVAGERGVATSGTTINPNWTSKAYGYYWSATGNSGSNAKQAYALYLNIKSTASDITKGKGTNRFQGCSVRLVTPVE